MTKAHPDTATMISAHSPAPQNGNGRARLLSSREISPARVHFTFMGSPLNPNLNPPPPRTLPSAFLRACARHGMPPTRFVLVVSIPRQSVALFEKHPSCAPGVFRLTTRISALPPCGWPLPSPREAGRGPGRGACSIQTPMCQYAPRHTLAKTFRCSTSKFGVGETAGSNMTPRGLHRVAQKIGGGWPVGAAFQGRKPVGFTWRGKPAATITSRIFWLEGLEPGFNRGGRVDSHSRHIYIHGTGNEPALGRPDSHGCVHLAADDLIPLYDKLPAGTLVWMAP